MGYKQSGFPMMDNSKSHGTNANYAKSGVNDSNGVPLKGGAPGFFGDVFKGAKKLGGKALRGEGIFGAMNPIGRIASDMMKKKQAAKNAALNTSQGAVESEQPLAPAVSEVPGLVSTAPLGSEGAGQINPEELGTQ